MFQKYGYSTYCGEKVTQLKKPLDVREALVKVKNQNQFL